MARKIFDFTTPPLMFAAWPGMGDVGLTAMEYIRKSVDARLFAELDMSPFYSPEEVVVKKGLARFPEIPKSFFMGQHDPDLVFFESTMQLGGTDAITVAEAVLDVAHKIRSPRIFTAAAFPYPMSYKSESRILAAANRQSLVMELSRYGIEPLPEGFISGLNGILLGIASSQNIEAACILATIPSYATGLLYPKGSVAIVDALSRIAGLDISTEELREQAQSFEQTYEQVEERLRQVFPDMVENQEDIFGVIPPESHGEEKKEDDVPEFVMKRIENLFREVAKNKNRDRAGELKTELDRWGIFDLYEKRFLDLFKEED